MSHYSFDTPGKLVLRIDNKCGDVRLLARPGTSTEVDVDGIGASASQLVDATEVEHRPSRDEAGTDVVVVNVPRPGGILRSLLNVNSPVTVSVHLPEGADVEVSTAAGDITADGAFGGATLNTASGGIRVTAVSGDLHANTASGDFSVVSVTGKAELASASGDIDCGTLEGRARIRTASGDVSVKVGRSHVTVESASGDVRIGEISDGCQVKTASGDQELERAVSGRARLETMTGDVTVGVARGTMVEVDAETLSGSISSDIALGDERPAPPAPDSAGADHDNAWLELRARTVSGDLTIKRVL